MESTMQRVYREVLGNREAREEFARLEADSNSGSAPKRDAALVSAHAGAYFYALSKGGGDTLYVESLRKVAEGKLDTKDERLFDFSAHVAWLVTEGYDGSEEVQKLADMSFDTLPPEQIKKDAKCVKQAAQFIVTRLGL